MKLSYREVFLHSEVQMTVRAVHSCCLIFFNQTAQEFYNLLLLNVSDYY